ncbi:MAG: hypothetical protein J2P41_12795 [Blastocatellia bacterium]|nr:hypothetical protein [Blastocatellia bacterium]
MSEEKRVVTAPQAGSADKSAQVISVELAEDEDVRWQWTHYPDGTSAVTGYEIIRKRSERSDE